MEGGFEKRETMKKEKPLLSKRGGWGRFSRR